MRPYRVSDLLKSELDHHIKELLDLQLIWLSNNPVASANICVAKKKRWCVLGVLSYTVVDAFPMPTVNEFCVQKSTYVYDTHICNVEDDDGDSIDD